MLMKKTRENLKEFTSDYYGYYYFSDKEGCEFTLADGTKKRRGYFKEILTKEFLINEYSAREQSMNQVADMIGCSKKYVLLKLKEFNIPRRMVNYALHLRNKRSFNLTQQIRSYIDGLLLGDGHISQKNKWSARYDQGITRCHGSWVKKIQQDFKDFGIESKIIEVHQNPTIMRKTGQQLREYHGFLLYTKFYTEFNDFRRRWYQTGSKTVPRDIMFTPQFLANWIMSDGDYDKSNGRLSFSVNALPLKDIDFLIEKFAKMNILAKNQMKHNKNVGYAQPRLRLNRENTNKVLRITDPHKVPTFNYKWGTT